ncbi:MAG: nucleotide sugar dehydrogenase [Paludibacteraceae bacterium]|nr:nucleotide sugar dehydrogenase [Paludibacteraceae bacterium]MBR6043435.1 nucleotide sugar dehydrogenase [Paludibacteraceae bacterium]
MKIGIIGLGYVGLPLAVEFAKLYRVVGFDINNQRIEELKGNNDQTQEADLEILKAEIANKQLTLTSNLNELKECNYYIVTVPTPIDKSNNPDLGPLLSASKSIGQILKKGDVVIYESTTYPGCTEEVCVPALEEESGLVYNQDFFCGYSPERINPGDKENTLTKIKKVTSGSTPEAAEKINTLYASIITAGTHLAPNIKVAEAAKAIENAQRDINISFVNELALIFDRIGIDTNDVLEAASTKWNFLHYKPGLVGGHCISVDPYYLAHKSISLGYYPEVILSGRHVNNSMAKFIAEKVIKLLIGKGSKLKGAKALILGFTFKENCPDTRNTKVVDIYRELTEYGLEVDVCDPWANPEKVAKEHDIKLQEFSASKHYDAIIVAVAHKQFMEFDFKQQKDNGAILFDVKGIIPRELVDARL